MSGKPVVDKFGRVCDSEAGEIGREISCKVSDYVERMLKEKRINLIEAHALENYFASEVMISSAETRMLYICKARKKAFNTAGTKSSRVGAIK